MRKMECPVGNNPDSKIFEVIAQGIQQEVIDFINQNPRSVYAEDPSGASPFHAILSNSSLEALPLLELLLFHTVDPNKKGRRGETVLQCAAFNGQGQCVELLLGEGVSINDRDDEGRTAIHYAIVTEQLDILKQLHAAGADLHSLDRLGQNVLHGAITWKSPKNILSWLLEQGVSMDQKDESGRVPMDCMRKDAELQAWVKGVMHAITEKKELERDLSGLAGQEQESQKKPVSSSPSRL